MEKITNQEVAEKIAVEGLDYTLRHYYGVDSNFKDKKLKELIKKYHEIADAIEELLPEVEEY